MLISLQLYCLPFNLMCWIRSSLLVFFFVKRDSGHNWKFVESILGSLHRSETVCQWLSSCRDTGRHKSSCINEILYYQLLISRPEAPTRFTVYRCILQLSAGHATVYENFFRQVSVKEISSTLCTFTWTLLFSVKFVAKFGVLNFVTILLKQLSNLNFHCS